MFWLTELSGLAAQETGERDAEEEAEEMDVSSPPLGSARCLATLDKCLDCLVSVPVMVSSDSEGRFESQDRAPCSVEVVQSEIPEVLEKEEILLSSSSTLRAPLASLKKSRKMRGRRG